MPLSINPLAKLVSSVSQQVSAAADSASGAMNGTQFASLKSNVDSTVSKLSGGIGTGLNGFTASASTFAADAKNALGGVTGAMGGIGNPIQSLASNARGLAANAQGAISSAAGAVGSVSNVASNIGASLDKLGLAGGGLGGGLAKLAGQVSSAAGMLNNLLSLARGKNLPSGAELFSAQGSFVELKPGSQNDWRVKVNCNFGLFGNAFSRLSETGGFVFPYLPNITVSTKANYTQIDPVHNLQPYYAYKNSQVDDIQISGEFSVETELDAEYWIQGTTFFKTATRMFYGTGENVGNPPVICQLSGYGARVFTGVPIIIKSFSVDLKEDVSYMKYNKGNAPTWVPTTSNITIVVAPIYNRTRLRQFSLKDYANGNTVAGAGFV